MCVWKSVSQVININNYKQNRDNVTAVNVVVVGPYEEEEEGSRYPIWGRSLIKNFGHVRDMVGF